MKIKVHKALFLGIGLSVALGALSHSASVAASFQQLAQEQPMTAAEKAAVKKYETSEKLGKDAQAALDAGNLKAAKQLALGRLKGADKDSWDYGNVVYESNQILGLVALKQGNVAQAKTYLIAAGKTPGSPTLNSFGPEMKLAQELFKKGEKKVVSDFLNLVAKFWATPPSGIKNEPSGIYADHAKMIARWQNEIKEGKTPSLDRYDFGAAEGPSTERPKLLAAGTVAPDFTALDKNGKEVKLSDLKGKIVVVDFWASWCPPCVRSMPHNQEVTKKLQAEGLPVVLLAVDNAEDRSAFLKWVAAHPELDALQFVHTEPSTNISGGSYKVSGIPTQYVIDANGVIRKSFVGFGEPNDDLEKAIRAANSLATPVPTP